MNIDDAMEIVRQALQAQYATTIPAGYKIARVAEYDPAKHPAPNLWMEARDFPNAQRLYLVTLHSDTGSIPALGETVNDALGRAITKAETRERDRASGVCPACRGDFKLLNLGDRRNRTVPGMRASGDSMSAAHPTSCPYAKPDCVPGTRCATCPGAMPPQPAERAVDRVAELEAENFALAADICHHGYAGDGGEHRCKYQDRIAELERAVDWRPIETYYAKEGKVWKRPIETAKPGGGVSVQIGFPVCKMLDVVGDEAAETVAELMNRGEACANLIPAAIDLHTTYDGAEWLKHSPRLPVWYRFHAAVAALLPAPRPEGE